MAAKPKKLSIEAVNKQYGEQFGSLKRISLSNGYYCEVHEKFKTTSIQKLVIDYHDVLEQLKKRDVSWTSTKDIIFVYYMLLLKHFTSLGEIIPADIDQMVAISEKLLDLGLMGEILEALDPAEVEKLNDTIGKMSENGKMLGAQIGELFVRAGDGASEQINQADGEGKA